LKERKCLLAKERHSLRLREPLGLFFLLASKASISFASACQSRGLTIGGGDVGFPFFGDVGFTSGSSDEPHEPTKVKPAPGRFAS